MRWTMLLMALASAALAAQDQPVFRTQSEVVVVHALVEDNRGAAVPGLTQENFLIYEDNYPQQVSVFSATDAPASIGLLIDNSTSMVPKRELVIAAAVQFAELSNPEDEIFVLAFNEHVREAWAPRVIEESDISLLRATLLDRISARGKTALYDAVNVALDRMAHARHTRQVLVVVSDGSDNASRSTLDTMLSRIQASHAMIYTVVLRDPVDRDGNPRLLRRLSHETGGESFMPRRIGDVPEALEHIARDIRATYTLGYVPTNQARDGTMRKLRVVASDPDGRTLKVQARGGYLAPGSGRSGGGPRAR
jgi:Ca-activated chloride channel homolog